MDGHLGFIYWQRGYLQHILGDESASEAYAVRDLTSRDLATLLDGWRGEDTELAAALGAPTDALHHMQAATRELGDIDFNAILNS